LEKQLTIACPISLHGAGQDKTFLHRHGIEIKGPKEEKKRVDMQGMTMKGSRYSGLWAENGLSFLCKDMTFTQCRDSGVGAVNTKGRLINCVITQCGESGICCNANALIEMAGDQTKVDGNGTSGRGYGLATSYRSSVIHLLFPLTKESVSTNNLGIGNYGGHGGTRSIETRGNMESKKTHHTKREKYNNNKNIYYLYYCTVYICTVLLRSFRLFVSFETFGLSMELNDDFLVRSTSLQTIARVKRVKSRLLQKVAQKMRGHFCAYLHGMYDFTRLTRTIVCREIDLC
jgi:hypothetical protein